MWPIYWEWLRQMVHILLVVLAYYVIKACLVYTVERRGGRTNPNGLKRRSTMKEGINKSSTYEAKTNWAPAHFSTILDPSSGVSHFGRRRTLTTALDPCKMTVWYVFIVSRGLYCPHQRLPNLLLSHQRKRSHERTTSQTWVPKLTYTSKQWQQMRNSE